MKEDTLMLRKLFSAHVYYLQNIILEIFFLNIFTNFSQFSNFQWDNDGGDVGGDCDGDGQLWDPKLTETIPNIY